MIGALPALLLLAASASPVLTLDDAVRTAREHQPQLLQARAGTLAAEARADQARAGLLPRLDASAGYRLATGNGAAVYDPVAQGSTVPRASWDTSSTLSATATASLLLWDFGKTPLQWRSAREQAGAQRASERATGQQVVLGVRTAFFAARAARDLVGVARQTLSNQEAHLRQIQGFVEVGTRPEIDLAQARTARANAEVQRIGAEATFETAKAQLNQAMGVEGSTDFEIADDRLPAVEGEETGLEPLLQEALQARPEVTALAAQARAQEATIGSVQGGYWPSLGVSTGLTDSGPDRSSFKTDWNWNAQATLGWNLFSGGATSASVREAEAGLASVRAQASALRQQIRLALEQARLGVLSARAKLTAAGEALVNAREQLRLAEGRYQAGSGSVLELSDAQLQVTLAAAQQVQADYDLSTARAQLLVALARP
jgi:outer membrane protein